MRTRKAGLVLAAIGGLFVTLVLGSACSDNGEGDRCDFDNGNDDCQVGLVCVPATAQGNRGAGYGTVNPNYQGDRCCPLPRATATHPACLVQNSDLVDSSTPLGDSALNADAGDASASDGATDAPADAADGG